MIHAQNPKISCNFNNTCILTGTIYLFGTLMYTLFDSRVINSFSSALYTKICHICT
jgi:hypothetical protein